MSEWVVHYSPGTFGRLKPSAEIICMRTGSRPHPCLEMKPKHCQCQSCFYLPTSYYSTVISQSLGSQHPPVSRPWCDAPMYLWLLRESKLLAYLCHLSNARLLCHLIPSVLLGKHCCALLFTSLAPSPFLSLFHSVPRNSGALFHGKQPHVLLLLLHLVFIQIWICHEALLPKASLGRSSLFCWVSQRL